MFAVKMKKGDWKKLLEEQDDYYYHDEKIDTDLLTIKEKGAYVEVTLEKDKLFQNEVISFEKIRDITSNLMKLALKNESLAAVKFDIKDLVGMEKNLKELDRANKVIKLDEDLNLIVDHPMFAKLSYQLRCWPDKNLVHPKVWKEDVEYLTQHKFQVIVTEDQKKILQQLATKEEKLFKTAYVYKSHKGYRLMLYSLQDETVEKLLEKCQIWYNKMTKKGMEQIQMVFIEDELKEQIEEEKPSNMTEVKALMKKGYKSYNAFMFTLPSILVFLKKNGITVHGGKELIPEYPKLDKFENGIKLFDFQKEAFNAWKENDMIGTIALPTGAGKTIIGLKCIEEVKRKRVLIVVPTVELVLQWKSMLMKHLKVPEDKIGIYYSQHKEVNDITIITFQSGHKKISAETEDSLADDIVKLSESSAFLILDEGHHAPAPVFQKIMINVKCPHRLSLTATPYREDKNESLAFLAIGDVVFTKDYASLAEQKVVSPIKFKTVNIKLTDEEEAIFQTKGEITARKRVTRDGYESWMSGTSGLTVDELQHRASEQYQEIYYNELRRELTLKIPEKPKIMDVLGFSEKKFSKLKSIITKHKNDKILIFNERIDGAKVLQYFLEKNGFEPRLLTGGTKPQDRKDIFKNFKESNSGILVTTTVLDEGIDVPDANVVIIFNATKSKRQMIQRVGRGCRYKKGKIEYVYELVAVPQNSTSIDNDIIGKLKKSMKSQQAYTGIYLGQWDFRSSEDGIDNPIKIEARKLMLLEKAKSSYRDISGIINLAKQEELIEKVEGGKK
jgi:superfamily II DNA or RNA helicase